MSTINIMRAKEQGYVAMADRPACRNCWACNERSQSCGYGAFAIDLDGWCPLWVPTIGWGETNRHSLDKMGLSMGDNLRAPDHGLVHPG